MTEEEQLEAPGLVQTGDVIGRPVRDAEGRRAGVVRELIVERETLTVRHFVVDLGLFRRRVLVPVEEVAESGAEFTLLRWGAEELVSLPNFDPARALTPSRIAELARAHPRAYGDLRDAPVSEASGILPIGEAKRIRLPRDSPDLRGWNVFGSDGERIGTVSDMLVDPDALKVRYLDVDLLDDLFTLDEDRHVLVPLEAVDLRERGRDIWLKDTPAAMLSRLPAYTGGALDPALEPRIRETFALSS